MALNQMQIVQRLQEVESKFFVCGKEFVDGLFQLHFERKIRPFLMTEEGNGDYRILMEKSDFEQLEKYFQDFIISPVMENQEEKEVYQALQEQ